MGRAGQVLKSILEDYSISQGRLAAAMGIGASNIYRWANEIRDPSSDTVIGIVIALRQINPEAAEAFKLLYFKDV